MTSTISRPTGSRMPDQKCSSDRGAENTVMPMTYSMNSATPCRYTTNSLRVIAATVKNSEPMKKICITTMDRKGCKYHQAWFGPIRAWSAQGAKVPTYAPTTSPKNTSTVVTNEPAQRPPK